MSQFITEQDWGRNVEARTVAEAMEKRYLLACPRLTVSSLLLLYLPGPPAQRWYCPVGWAFFHQLALRKCHTDVPRGQSERGKASVEVSSSQVCPVCV